MNIAELSIVVSFTCFLILFFKKAYPFVVDGIDSYIAEVRKKIDDAERLKSDAVSALAQAEKRRKETELEIEEYRKRSQARIEQLEQENKKYLELLEAKNAEALEKQLNVELAKQKQELINKLSDLVIAKLSDRIQKEQLSASINISQEDLSLLK